MEQAGREQVGGENPPISEGYSPDSSGSSLPSGPFPSRKVPEEGSRGRRPMISGSLVGQIREPRDEPTESGDVSSDGEETESEEGSETLTRRISSKGASVPCGTGDPSKVSRKPKGGKKKAREGYALDECFPVASLIPPKESLCDNIGWVDEFYRELVAGGHRKDITPETLCLIPPASEDRAFDANRGMCVFWKMPRCGFRLPLSLFERALLVELNVTPSQLTSTSWCTITSFERIFVDFAEELRGAKPSVPLFCHFFCLAISSMDYLTVKRRLGGVEIFDSHNPKIQMIHEWREGWVWIPSPEKVSSLEGIRQDWRPLGKGFEGKPAFELKMSKDEEQVARKIERLVEC